MTCQRTSTACNTTSVPILRQGHQSSMLRSTRPHLAALLGSYVCMHVCMRFHSHLMEKKRAILRGTCSGVIHNVDSSNRTQGEQNQPPCATNNLASAHQPFFRAMHRCVYLAWHGPTTRKKISVGGVLRPEPGSVRQRTQMGRTSSKNVRTCRPEKREVEPSVERTMMASPLFSRRIIVRPCDRSPRKKSTSKNTGDMKKAGGSRPSLAAPFSNHSMRTAYFNKHPNQ